MTVFNIYFDGGGSGQWAYGSWEVEWNGFKKRVQRRSFKHHAGCTSNVAEYLALLGALEWLKTVKDKGQYRVRIHGDSLLVINQIKRVWRTRKDHLACLRDEVIGLLREFGGWEALWHRRINSVSRFGH